MGKDRVIVKKEIVTQKIEEFETERWYPVPDFKKDGEEIPCFKVKMAGLDDQIKAQELSSNPGRLLNRFIKLMQQGEEIDYAEFRKQLHYDDIHPKAMQACEIFQRCVIEPEFTIGEVLRLSETHPDLVNNVALFALGGEEEKK